MINGANVTDPAIPRVYTWSSVGVTTRMIGESIEYRQFAFTFKVNETELDWPFGRVAVI
jgi:hypothetical protein